MVKFIHSGDIHLGLKFKNVSFGGDKGKTRRLELWQSFRRLISYGIEEEVDIILLAGDIFESDFVTLSDLKRFADILSGAKKQEIFIISGNHDTIGSDSIFGRIQFGENVHVFSSDKLESFLIERLNTRVYGLNWDRKIKDVTGVLEDIKSEDGIKSILLLHGDINGDNDYMPIDIEYLKTLNLDYVALGHIHKPEIIAENIAYCGSLEPLDFGETGERGFIKGIIKENTNIEFHPFSLREFRMLDMEIKDDTTYEQLYDTILKNSEKGRDTNFYRINLKGFLPMEIDKILLEEELRSYFYHLELNFDTISIDLDRLKEENKDSIIHRYINSFTHEELEDPIYYDALTAGIHALLEGGK